MIHAAYLRVYLPVERSPLRVEHAPPERSGPVVTLGAVGIWQEPLKDDAYRVEWSGSTWLCPRYPRLRMLEGLLAFRNSYPGVTGSLLVPETVARRASEELEALYRHHPDAKSHILTSPWHVPLRWFAGFNPEQRELFQRTDGRRSIRYRSLLGDAKRRLARTVDVLTEAGFDESITAQVTDLSTWLDGFEAVAMVELDYGSVAELFTDGELVMDESAADIAASLEALSEGRVDDAGGHYAAAASRWAPAQALMYSN